MFCAQSLASRTPWLNAFCTTAHCALQMYLVLGQPVSCPTHRHCVCSAAGVALARGRYRLCSGSSWNVAGTTAEVRRSGIGLGSARRRPPADFLPVLTGFPSCSSGPRRRHRLIFAVTNSTDIGTGSGRGTPVCPSCKLDCLDLGTLRFFRSAARLARLQRFISQLPPLALVCNNVHE